MINRPYEKTYNAVGNVTNPILNGMMYKTMHPNRKARRIRTSPSQNNRPLNKVRKKDGSIIKRFIRHLRGIYKSKNTATWNVQR